MPIFVNQITISDIIQTLAIVVAIIGLFFNFAQLKSGNKQKRAEYIISLYNQYMSDKNMLDIYYKIEYQKLKYSSDFHGSDDEKNLDKLLEFYDNIAKLYELKNFTLEDLDYVAYRYLIIYQDQSVKVYLEFLDNWFEKRGMKLKPFLNFRKVGKVLQKKYFKSNDKK